VTRIIMKVFIKGIPSIRMGCKSLTLQQPTNHQKPKNTINMKTPNLLKQIKEWQTNRWKPLPDWLFKQFSCFGIPYTNHNIFSSAYDGPIQRTPNQTLGSWSFLHENRRSPSRLYFKNVNGILLKSASSFTQNSKEEKNWIKKKKKFKEEKTA
jgi:hypothetical protein